MKLQPLHLQSTRRVNEREERLKRGKEAQPNGESRAAAARMFLPPPLGHRGTLDKPRWPPFLSDEGGKCLLSSRSPWEAQVIHVSTAVAPGKGSPGGSGGGSTLGRSGSPAPLIWAQGITPQGKSPRDCWSLRAPGTITAAVGVAKVRSGSWLRQSRSGSGARRRGAPETARAGLPGKERGPRWHPWTPCLGKRGEN